MTDILTPTIRLTEPTPGGDSGTWATLLNSDMAYIDEAINQSVTVSIADVNVVLIADGTVSDQARYLRYNFTGALTADRTVTLPANVKVGWASNNTTGGHNVILSAGGTTISLADGSWTFFNCDGSNVITQTVRFGALVGTTTNDSAASGQIGEFISSSIPTGSAVVLATNVARNVTSISLTAGDWDVWGSVGFLPVGSATMTILHAAISLTSGGFDADPAGGGHVELSVAFNADNAQLLPAGMRRISVASTTTVYLIANQAFAGTLTAYGFIGARRRR